MGLVGMAGNIAKGVAKGAGSAAAGVAKDAAGKVAEGYAKVSATAAKDAANVAGKGIVKEAIRNAGEEAISKAAMKEASKTTAEEFGKMTVKDLKSMAQDLGVDLKGSSKWKKADWQSHIQDFMAEKGASFADEAVEGGGKMAKAKIPGAIKKNALLGGAAGALIGGGAGGIMATASGADDDNTKAMIVTGALAGGIGGALVGGGAKMLGKGAGSVASASSGGGKALGQAASDVAQNGVEAAADIAAGEANHSVMGGAKGFFEDIGSKLDDLGSSIRNAVDAEDIAFNNKAQEALGKYGTFKGSVEGTPLSEDTFNFMKGLADENATGSTLGNVLGKAGQGAAIGAAGGLITGGIAGATDEDESLAGGALRGALAGGLLGGIGGGASHLVTGNNGGRLFNSAVTSAV